MMGKALFNNNYYYYFYAYPRTYDASGFLVFSTK
ncbi:hypothetical protein SDC9_136465 [bioreactor metagenome]|uniref:Uncharacterized protein n=1 Tax=bioreactor metagenome TaxID=1076179 RepID=A0A645DJ72_9ZZZZ|nr:hypothetical protein HMPREF1006_02084 [Synergistes sp. 3_1_syn1]